MVSLPSHRRPLGDPGKSNQHCVWPLPLLAFLLLELFKLLCRLAVRSNLLLKHCFDDSLAFRHGDLDIGRDCRLVACDPQIGQPPEVMPGFVVEPPFLLFFEIVSCYVSNDLLEEFKLLFVCRSDHC